MSRVFITQQPVPNRLNWVPNLEPAAKYGEFVYIYQGAEKPWTDPAGAMDQASQILKNFNPEEDYILWPNTGDPAGVWAILLVLARLPIHKVRFLYWERKLTDGVRSRTEGFYSPITFNLY